MSRLQLALNVTDLDQAIDFYSKLFGARPAKVRPGYANFAITDPPLKLVLIESTEVREPGVVGALNHLGVEVGTPAEVSEANARLTSQGMVTSKQCGTTCCYAVQEKVWIEDPDGSPWEIYTVLSDEPVGSGMGDGGTCCYAMAQGAPASASAHLCC